jgi:hypothetical protein
MSDFKKDDEQRPIGGSPAKAKGLFDEESEVKQADPLAILAARQQEEAVVRSNEQVEVAVAQKAKDGMLAKFKRLVGIVSTEERIRKELGELMPKGGSSSCGCW